MITARRGRPEALTNVRIGHRIADRHPVKSPLVEDQAAIRRMVISPVKLHISIRIRIPFAPKSPDLRVIRAHPVRRRRNRRADEDPLPPLGVFPSEFSTDQSPRPNARFVRLRIHATHTGRK